MRVAFTLFAGRNWLGGYNYLLNFCRVIGAYSEGRLIPVMFAGDDIDEKDLQPFRQIGCEVVVSAALNRERKTKRLLRAMLTGKDGDAEQLFRQNDIDVVFEHAAYFGWRFGLPAIAWLGDFQHRYFPGLFSKKAWWKRDVGMRVQIMSGRTVMVSSEMARRDCKTFYGLSPERVHVVRFSVPAPSVRDQDMNAVRERYGLPRYFFHIPNQFWKHKNHLLVVRALSLLKGKGVVVVATGRCEDLRHPEYFPELKRLVDKEGLADCFRILGVVPYVDMVAMMKGAIAVINPSLFEGWSTTVEEARALGANMLLSDIPVHREQMGDAARYFSVESPSELAALILDCVEQSPSDRPVSLNGDQEHLRRFVRDFDVAICAAVSAEHEVV